jgi:hypothetical protein
VILGDLAPFIFYLMSIEMETYFVIAGCLLSLILLILFIVFRRKDFGRGNRILKIEVNPNDVDKFEVTIKNENNVIKIGIYKAAIINSDGLITDLCTIDELNKRPRMDIEAGGIQTIVVTPLCYDPARYSPRPCRFSIIDTNGKRNEVELRPSNVGILYEAEL